MVARAAKLCGMKGTFVRKTLNTRQNRFRTLGAATEEEFAGSGQFNPGPIRAEAVPQNQLPCSAVICVPPLATVYFRVKKPE